MKGQCPKCDKTLLYAKTATLVIRDADVSEDGYAILCPHCGCILSADFCPSSSLRNIESMIRRVLRGM